MAQCAFFAHNLLTPHPRHLTGAGRGGFSTILGASPADPNTPFENVRDPRPRVVFSHPASNGGFQITSKNQWIDFKFIPAAGGGATATLKIPAGFYNTPAALASQIQSLINGSAPGAGMHVNTSFTVIHNVDGYFEIEMHATASDQYQILWKTGSHGTGGADNNVGAVLGFYLLGTTVNDSATFGTGQPVYKALRARFSGATYLRGRTQAIGDDMAPTSPKVNLFSCHLFAQGDWSHLVTLSGTRPDFTDVQIYTSVGADFGDHENDWMNAVTAGTASVYSFTERDNVDHISSETDNALQIAMSIADTPPSVKYWYFSWKYQDSMRTHEVGTLGLWMKSGEGTHKEGSSPSRTISQIRGLQILDDSTTMTPANAYPASGLQRWELPLRFDYWTMAEWHDVFEETVRTARQLPCIFILNWTAIVAE